MKRGGIRGNGTPKIRLSEFLFYKYLQRQQYGIVAKHRKRLTKGGIGTRELPGLRQPSHETAPCGDLPWVALDAGLDDFYRRAEVAGSVKTSRVLSPGGMIGWGRYGRC